MRRLLLRLFGARTVEGVDAVRVTIPRWWGDFGRKTLDNAGERVRAGAADDGTALEIERPTDRTLIIRYGRPE